MNRTPIPQITQAWKHFPFRTRIEPHEIFMITLDEEGRPRRPSVLFEPHRKVTRTIMMASSLVDPTWIRPHTKIPDVQHIVEANTQRCFERENVLIETVHCSVNITCGTNEHCASRLTHAAGVL
jgi:hypothetical protein